MNPARPPVTVIGGGYVGLVTAVGLASLGRDVQLVETGAVRLQALCEGRIPIHEDGLQDAFDAAVAAGCLTVTDTVPPVPGIILVCVGTPIGDDGRSDLSQLDAAMAALRERLGPGRDHIQYLASVFHSDTPNDTAPAAYNNPELGDGLPTSPLEPNYSETGFRRED